MKKEDCLELFETILFSLVCPFALLLKRDRQSTKLKDKEFKHERTESMERKCS